MKLLGFLIVIVCVTLGYTLAGGKLTVSVKDRQGNVTRIERTFSAGPSPGR